MRHGFIVTPLLAAFAFAGAARAETATLAPEADAHAYMGSPYENYGRSAFLRARNNPTSAMKTWIRFDLGKIDRSTITGATLKLSAYQDGTWFNQEFRVFGLKDGHDSEDWIEGDSGKTSSEGLTWNDAPANAIDSPTDFTEDAVALGSFMPEADTKGYQSFTSAELVVFLKADTNGKVTLMIATEGRAIQSIDARTRPTPPRLEVTHGR